MKIYTLSLILSVALIAGSCSSTQKETEEKSTLSDKDISELTYADVIQVVFDDEGEGIEWHGEESPNDFKDFIKFSTNGKCGDGECGERTFITNTHESAILDIIIKGDYNLEGDVGYIARKFRIAPQQELNIGCSHLCHKGKPYSFKRTVVASSESDNS